MKPPTMPVKPGMKYLAAVLTFCLLAVMPCKLGATGMETLRPAADDPAPYLEDFVLGKSNETITLALRVKNPFDRKLKALILDGVPQKIVLKTWTSERKNYLFVVNFNRLIHNNVIIHQLQYDNLKKLFVVTGSDLENPLETPTYDQALRAAARFADVPLLDLVNARPGARYQVKIRAEIRKIRLPFHLEYLFFFLAAWDRKTQSYTLEIPDHFLPPPAGLDRPVNDR